MYLTYIFEQDQPSKGMIYVSEDKKDLDSIVKDITKTHGEAFGSLKLDLLQDFYRLNLDKYERFNGTLHEVFPGLTKKEGPTSILYVNPNEPNMERVYELFKTNISLTGPIDLTKIKDGMLGPMGYS